MGVNRVDLADETLIDITDSTVNSNNLMSGAVAYGADGERVVGSVITADVIDNLTSTSTTDALSANQGRVLDTTKANKSNTYTKTETVNAIVQQIGLLNMSGFGGDDKYISAVSETKGKISATVKNISDLVNGTDVIVSDNKIGLSSQVTQKLSELDNKTTYLDSNGKIGSDNVKVGDSTLTEELSALPNNLFNKIETVANIVGSTTLAYSGVSVTIPANSIYSINGVSLYNDSNVKEVALSKSSSNADNYNLLAYTDKASYCTISGYTSTQLTIYLFTSHYANGGTNASGINGFYVKL